MTRSGRLDTVTTGGQVVSSNTDDGFDHVVSHQQENATGGLDTTSYTYDPFDRKTCQTSARRIFQRIRRKISRVTGRQSGGSSTYE
jgi:YD repeat-containing protein